MDLRTFICLVSVILVADSSEATKNHFEISSSLPSAKEGSCITLTLRVTDSYSLTDGDWFWIKDPLWKNNDLEDPVILSANSHLRTVHPDFASRVKPVDDQRLSRTRKNILICDLKKSDSGNYAFRYIQGNFKWITESAVVVVDDNPCPITFENPSPVTEASTVTLTCSTLTSCSSQPQIWASDWPIKPQKQNGKTSTVSFTVGQQGDSRKFSCQTENNSDHYLIKNITLEVEYAPRSTKVKVSESFIKEGDKVTLICSSDGKPTPTFTWSRNLQTLSTEPKWLVSSITAEKSGTYTCEAKNVHGKESSSIVIDVRYVPTVEIRPAPTTFRQGDKMELTCIVTRSNPSPQRYSWSKDGKPVSWRSTYVVESVQPEHAGLYECKAQNNVGMGTPASHRFQVQYRPRKTTVSNSASARVKIGTQLTLECRTDANPAATKYSWSLHKQSQHVPSMPTGKSLKLRSVQSRDAACYTCNATNAIGTGENSEPLCIQVLYRPSKPTMSMDAVVREGELLSIACSVESFPSSHLKLYRMPRGSPVHRAHSNTLFFQFNATSSDAGDYRCEANNSEGKSSTQRALEVRYAPKYVTVKALPDPMVNENMTLKLQCRTASHPAVTSVTWWREIGGKVEALEKTETVTIESVTPSDSGLYYCSATNDIGTGSSPQVQVMVNYAPKDTRITQAAEQQLSDGMSSVALSCSSHSFPPIKEYFWYKKTEDSDGADKEVSYSQNFTVFSDQPGIYYCVAKNDVNDRKSEHVRVFLDKSLMRALTFLIPLLCIVSILVFIFFMFRHRRKKAIQQNTPLQMSALANRRTDSPVFAGRHVEVQSSELRTNCRDTHTIYSTVNLPSAGQGLPPAASSLQSGHGQDDSVHYASLQFGREREKDAVYAGVLKPKRPK
ncbi:B-cell receptor CD22 [Entelurus aequoreus]|uniref:B-cell receptor CD22 n=1 Tax=Entelurus aequoreus TaxID=161455 RepID=UPI002B1E5FFD|nr:B-cell receptor CD22 [Entelurus aequoreus]